MPLWSNRSEIAPSDGRRLAACGACRWEGIPSLSPNNNGQMENDRVKQKIHWYRSPVPRDLLAELNRRSDWKGLLQTLGHLGLLTLTGAAAWLTAARSSWGWMLLFLFLHGTCYAFLLNGFHELCHSTVFR